MKVVSGKQWPMWPRQDIWNRRTARIGQLGKDRTGQVRTGYLGQDDLGPDN